MMQRTGQTEPCRFSCCQKRKEEGGERHLVILQLFTSWYKRDSSSHHRYCYRTEMCPCTKCLRPSFAENAYISKLLRTPAKLPRITWFASTPLNFEISLCLMLHNKHRVDLTIHQLATADAAAHGEPGEELVPSTMPHANGHCSDYEDNGPVQTCQILESSGGDREY